MTMSGIRIHRCRLRLVRHGGWSWGPDPRAFLQVVVRALPALLAAALEDLWPEEPEAPEDVEREIAAPVRLRLGIRQSLLLEALAGLSPDGRPPAGSPAADLARYLATSLKVALAGDIDPKASCDPLKIPPTVETPRGASPAVGFPTVAPPATAFLAVASPATAPPATAFPAVASPAMAFSATAPPAVASPTVAPPATVSPVAPPFLSRNPHDAAPLPGRLGRSPDDRTSGEGDAPRGVSTVGGTAYRPAATSSPMEPGGEGAPDRPPSLRQEVQAAETPGMDERNEETAALRWHPAQTSGDIVERPVPGSASRAALRARPPLSVRPIPRRDAEVHVASALPFLLLGPLSRTGYLETLAATFAAAGLLSDLPLFAAALAAKTLPPPERGWRRTPAAAGAAAACAGLLDSVSGEDLRGFARRASACLEPLEADLAASLLAGHEPGRPLLLTAAGEGLLLAEADGVFPIAWAPDLAGLRHVLGGGAPSPGGRGGDGRGGQGVRSLSETLLVPAEAATPALLREIDASGFRFVTAAPPTRGEPWRPLRLPDRHRAWTNDPAAPGLARQAAGLAVAEDGARRLWQALGVERPSLPAVADPALDRHLTLAAGLALGTLAWTLWREREPVDPVLALERFGDLEARVRFRAHSVHVLLPLGRRHRDLLEHRLLEPVRDAVWLDGRVLEFGGG